MERKVGVFLVGVQRSGTTELADRLARTPGIVGGDKKELDFFNDDTVDWDAVDYSEYESRFQPGERETGLDATPVYCYWPDSIERIAVYNPLARIILVLRHPVLRAYSHFMLASSRGESRSFDEAFASEPLPEFRRQRSYRQRGFYSWQVERILEHFPKEQVCFLTSDELWSKQAAAEERISSLIGAELASASLRARQRQPLVGEDLRRYTETYAEDIVQTQRLSGLDLSIWLAGDYIEVGRDAEVRK